MLNRKTVGYLIATAGLLGTVALGYIWTQVKESSCRHPNVLRDGARDPQQLITIARSCIVDNRLAAAHNAWITARLYALYDMRRIDDRSAHAYYGVMPYMVTGGFSKEQVALFSQTPEHIDKSVFCQRWTTLPPPRYEPNYMLHHGMKAFTGQPLKANAIDEKAVWASVLNQGLKSYCPAEFLPATN